MRYEDLHEYQKYSARFEVEHPLAALFLDCGLGKTVTTLTAIDELMFDRFEVGRALVICPLRVGAVWRDEVRKWEHLRGLKVSVAIGTDAERRKAMESAADIYVINRENVQWLCDNYPEFFGRELMIVVDELSSFKSWQSKRFKALMKMRPKVHRIVGLTGTPSSNGLMDLFAEFKLLDMGERLGRFIGQYRTMYFKPDKFNGPVVYSYKPLPGAEDAIYKRIGDMTISMRSKDHLKMPELISCTHEAELSDEEKKTYKQLKDELIISMPEGKVTASNAASLSGKLSQMSNGAVYGDDGEVRWIHDRKLDALEDIIESMNGRPVLVAYWFKHDLDRIMIRFEAAEKLDTEDSIRRWNEGRIPVALIHPASAGHGLNLQHGGNTLVWFGLTWSLELYQQTVARLWRQGQQSGTVVIMHIISKGTIDERMMKALEKKDMTQSALIDAVKAEIGGKDGSI